MAYRRALALICLLITGCGSPIASPTSQPTATPGSTMTGAPTISPAPTANTTPAPSATATLVPTEEPSFVTPNTFVETGSMNQRRRGNDAVLLLDGRVLAAGGETVATDILDSAEVYDPNEGTWTMVGSMGDRRVYAVVVVLSTGHVLVAGGYGPGDTLLASAEIFDPATGTFTPTGAMSVGRARFQGVRLDNGRVLVLGGNAEVGAHDSAEIYDPATGTWSATGSMHTTREALRAVRMADGRVVVTGGSDGIGDGTATNSTEIYDPLIGTFGQIGPMTVARDRHAIVLLGDTRVILAGGQSNSGIERASDIFDPRIGATVWTETAPLGDRRYAASYVTLADGNALICGGFNGTSYLRGCEIYDAATDAWHDADQLSQATSGALMVTLADGQVLVCGGLGDGDDTLKTCDLYTEVFI